MPFSYVEHGFPLGRWVARKRYEAKAGRLARDFVAKLEALPGWTWSAHGRFHRGDEHALRAFQRFAKRTGHNSISSDFREGGVSLGRRVRGWRNAFLAGKLDRSLARQLETLPGWTWKNAWEKAFARGIERLQHFVRREGHARVPVGHVEAGYKLGAWVAYKRRDYKKGRLPEYQVKALVPLPGWTWDARPPRSS